MLVYRVLTALFLLPLVFVGIFHLSTLSFSITCAILVLLLSHEYLGMFGLRVTRQLPLLLGQLSIFILCDYYIPAITVYSAFIAWLFVFMAILIMPSVLSTLQRSGNQRWLLLLLGLWQIQACLVAINQLHQQTHGALWLLFLLLLIWSADTGAYFAGRAIGRHKLAPMISPNKTWEGLIGALILQLIVLGLACYSWNMSTKQWLGFVILTVVILAVSVLGDLAESLIKRILDRKDSGRLLPGHGGLLDRVDSLLPASVFFYLGLNFILQFGPIHCTLAGQ